MSKLAQAIWVEMLKARRSRMPLVTALGFSMVPLGGGFFMIVLRDPEFARRVGLISAKAQITIGVADWPAYLGFLTLATAAGGIILFGLVAIWVFGREYSDRTAKDLLALPTTRSAIVVAKFAVVALWAIALTVIMVLIGLGVGTAIALPPVSTEVFWQWMITIAVSAGLTIVLVTPVAFFASAGHGYLPPIGIMILIMALAQVLSYAGWGEFFPWSIPALYAQGGSLGAANYAIVILTGVAGMAGTILWWELADQTH